MAAALCFTLPKKVVTMRFTKVVPSLLVLTLSGAVFNTCAASGSSPLEVQAYKTLPMKKMGSGVEISYRIEGMPAPGSPVIIHLTTSSRSDAQISLRGGDGLVVAQSGSVLQSAAGQITQHRIEVTPQTNGRLYLYLESSANGRGSSNAIALQVGKSDVQRKPSGNVQLPEGNVQLMPNGERVISVPAKQ